jgi:hypothetical protein
MKLRIPVTAILGIILFFSTHTAALSAMLCDDQSARLVARAYVLAIPLLSRENELIPLLDENKAYFLEGGGATRCMQALGAALMRGGSSGAVLGNGYSATERFGGSMPQGLEHLPGQVDASMRGYGSDMLTMGQELLWLSQVLPPAVDGDYEPYNTTSTPNRQMIAQAVPLYQMLCQMDPEVCQVMLGMMQQTLPELEQQIYALARQLSR